MTNIQWIGSWASICAYNWLDIVALLTGLLNIFFWLILSLPQYAKLFKHKTAAAQGLSISMLLAWWAADVLGLVGLILSGEFGTLLWLTIFFTANNSFAIVIWFYYAKIYPKYFAQESHDGYTSLDDDSSDETKGLLDNDSDDDEKHGQVLVLGRKRSSLSTSTSRTSTSSTQSQLPPSETSKEALIGDDDLLDVPISLVGIENSINVVSSGGNGQYAPHDGSFSMSLRNPLHPHTFALIVCLIAIAALPQIDAERINQVGQILKDTANVALKAVLGDDALAPCVPVHLPSTIRRIIGFSLTATCAFLNSVSRIPQLVLNKNRKTTAGLSLTFIIFQLCANFAFFFSRFTPTNLVFDMHWFETSFPWVIATTFSTVCLVGLLWQIYFYGNGASILARRQFKYARSFFDRVFFFLPARKPGQEDDGYDSYYIAIEHFEENPEEFFRVVSQLQTKRMYKNIDSLDAIDNDIIITKGNDDLDGIDAEMDDVFPEDLITEKDIKTVEQSNFHNPMFGITTEQEVDSILHAAIVQSSSFLRTGSFSRTPSSMALQRSTSKLPRTSSRFQGGLTSGKSFAHTKSSLYEDLP